MAKKNTKSPSERAQEALDRANRVVATAQKRLDAAKAAVTPLESDLERAQKRRDYLAQDPDLPANVPPTSSRQAGDADADA